MKNLGITERRSRVGKKKRYWRGSLCLRKGYTVTSGSRLINFYKISMKVNVIHSIVLTVKVRMALIGFLFLCRNVVYFLDTRTMREAKELVRDSQTDTAAVIHCDG